MAKRRWKLAAEDEGGRNTKFLEFVSMLARRIGKKEYVSKQESKERTQY